MPEAEGIKKMPVDSNSYIKLHTKMWKTGSPRLKSKGTSILMDIG